MAKGTFSIEFSYVVVCRSRCFCCSNIHLYMSLLPSRISIIIWGLAEGVKEEDGSPPLLGSDGQGPHGQRRNGNRRH